MLFPAGRHLPRFSPLIVGSCFFLGGGRECGFGGVLVCFFLCVWVLEVFGAFGVVLVRFGGVFGPWECFDRVSGWLWEVCVCVLFC